MYLAIFIQFVFCDSHTVFSASHKSERNSCFFIFFKDKFIFSRIIWQNSRTIPGLCEPCKRMSHIICHINPQIQFVDICCSHGMSLAVFTHCDLDLRSQFLKKCTHSRSPILFMVAFHFWYVDTSWTLESHQMFPGHCDLELWFLL